MSQLTEKVMRQLQQLQIDNKGQENISLTNLQEMEALLDRLEDVGLIEKAQFNLSPMSSDHLALVAS